MTRYTTEERVAAGLASQARRTAAEDKALRSALWTMAASAGIPVERRDEWCDQGIRLIRAERAVHVRREAELADFLQWLAPHLANDRDRSLAIARKYLGPEISPAEFYLYGDGVDPGFSTDVPGMAPPKANSDPWQWLHDNEFSWDDVNAIAAILDAGGFEITETERET